MDAPPVRRPRRPAPEPLSPRARRAVVWLLVANAAIYLAVVGFR